MASPGCDAVIVHEPAPVRCTKAGCSGGPSTVQLPVAVKLTGNPEVAVALILKSGSPNVLFASGPNVIVWSAFAMLKLCGTFAAALKFASPACEAVIVQAPAPVRCTVPGDALVTVHCPLAPKLTGNPEDAVALTKKSGSPNVLFASAPNVIVWLALLIVSVKLASVAVPQLSVARIVMVCAPTGAALLINTTPVVLFTLIVPV